MKRTNTISRSEQCGSWNRREFTFGAFSFAVSAQIPGKSDSAERLKSFNSALERLRSNTQWANSAIANDEPVVAALTGLERAPIRYPKSNTTISQRASALIVASEVTGELAYRDHYEKPVWPKGASGVTIGIGYDLGASTVRFFDEDWSEYLNDNQKSILKGGCGIGGEHAASLARSMNMIRIPWKVAYAQYSSEALPRYVGLTEHSLDNTRLLSTDSLGAIISLVYNRGASFSSAGERYREMRDIKEHMAAQRFDLVPACIRSMKRLWIGKKKFDGVVIRREAEASLFELGLSG